jgi:UDP-glucose 4-epimerase
MCVLIIGGNGFIGSHVLDVLREQGFDCVVYDRCPERFRSPLPRVRYVFGDLMDTDVLERTISQGIDSVIHLASLTALRTNGHDLGSDVDDVSAALGLLKLCVKHKVKKFVFASSGGTVYGIPQILPVSENHPTDPICSYEIVKLAIEKYLRLYQHLFGLSCVALRIANPYGIRQAPDSAQGVASIFLSKLVQGKSLTLWGDGSIVRDFVSVRDIARLFSMTLRSDATGVFNAGTGVGTSLNELLTLMSSLLGVKPHVVHGRPRDFDVPAVILDCDKARREYSWQPSLTLSDDLAEVANWLECLEPKSAATYR